MCYYNKTTFWGVEIFFAVKFAKGEFRSTHKTLQKKPWSQGGLAQNFSQTNYQTYSWWAFLKNTTTYDRAQPQTALFEAAWIRAKVGVGEGKANAL